MDNYIFRSIKILDIGYITTLYFSIALICSNVTERILGEYKPEEDDKKPIQLIILELLLHAYVIGIIFYVIRNIVYVIPSPFDGINNLDHHRINELKNAHMFGVIFVYTQTYFRTRLLYVHERLLGRNKSNNINHTS